MDLITERFIGNIQLTCREGFSLSSCGMNNIQGNNTKKTGRFKFSRMEVMFSGLDHRYFIYIDC
jgi:hypothetical protein